MAAKAPAKAPAAAPAKAAAPAAAAPAKAAAPAAAGAKVAWVQGTASWQAHAAKIKKDPNVKDAGLYGLDGATWWNGDLKVTHDEIKALVAGWKDTTKFQASGIVVGGVKYMFLSKRDEVKGADAKHSICSQIIGRKGPNSVLLISSTKGLIITVTKDGANPANVVTNEEVRTGLMKTNF